MRFLFFSNFFSHYRFAQAVALFTIGILLGAAMANLAIGQQIEKLYSEKNYLEVQLSEKEQQVKALEDKVADAKRWLLVQEISIELTLPERNFPDRKNLQLKMEETIKDMLKNIRGKRVKDLDPQVIWHIVDDRNIEVLGYAFNLEVKSVLVSEKIVFNIYAKYMDPQQNSEPVF